jgi:ABC-type maltose transport system permease subunit
MRTEMEAISTVVTGALVGLVALLGLFLSAHATDATIYPVGLALFGFGVLFDFWLVKRWFDTAERRG